MKIAQLQNIENRIFVVRDVQVMLDYHLAEIYNVETKRLNEQVKRNSKRFPSSFMFQLNSAEWNALQSQIATAKRRTLPFVFSEQGVAMLSAVLNSQRAIEASIMIMQAFVSMRRFMLQSASVFQRLDNLEIKQIRTDEKISLIFEALDAKSPSRIAVFSSMVHEVLKRIK